MLINNMDTLIYFISETSESSGFEGTILPKALKSFAKVNSIEFLNTLTKIIVEKISKKTNRKFDDYTVYPLALHGDTMHIFNVTIELLNNFLEKNEELKNILCSLILLRHFEPVDHSQCINTVVKVINKLLELLISSEEEENKKKILLFTICVALKTLLHFKNKITDLSDLNSDFFVEKMLKTLKTDKSILALKAFNLFLTLQNGYTFSGNCLEELNKTIQEWLLSSQTNSRLLAVNSLQKLEEFKEKPLKLMMKALQDASDAEFVPLTVNDYRNKLMILDRLKFELMSSVEEENHKVR